MFNRVEETYRMYKRPEGYDFMKDARSVGVPVSLDSHTYRYAFSDDHETSGGPAKRQKTLSGQPMESFEYRLARSVRRLGEIILDISFIHHDL